jgi:betaine-homocysteine S-methyltransferase
MAKGILERLADGPVLGDGGYIVELEQRGWVIAGAFTPEVVVRHPAAVSELHHEMANAGAEVLQVMAFYGSRGKLGTVGEAENTREINRAALQLAQEVAGDELLVAGDLSETWLWRPGDAAAEHEVAAAFDEQIEAQQGVDFWIGETFFQLGEAELCLRRIKANSDRPAMITLAFRATNTTDDGVTAAECARRLSDAGAEIVGVNCMRDPERTYPIIAEMRAATDAYLAAQPVAYRTSDEVPWFTGTPAFPDRLEPTRLTRFDMADFAVRARDMGVDYIGSCCGSGAQHVREMARALGKYRETQRWTPDPSRPMSETEQNWDRVQFGERRPRTPAPG